ncbi:uncharacterized protein LOC131021764 [Salvia miltiorrhiza]|uniref:uncharacterized protein LOC131021727 n=1 Tax=Salvia miltiorrhiza TaxID=226208 RepID=UPI0025ABE48A|nr:uncharacterized protein LOC131021727 [Salvia miltiorrhiza]XP_057807029.1 uncharacterized protein LOC131021764 [Salvia miltiorrhiza]
MSGLGDEFIVESFKVPWLIWIQLIVMFLLIILLFFGFGVFTLEPSSYLAASPSTAATPPPHRSNPSSSHTRAKAEVQGTRRDRASSAEFTREVQNGEESSSKDSSFSRIHNHPCNYFDIAKRAVLKCLGLDSSSEPSRSDQHEKQE